MARERTRAVCDGLRAAIDACEDWLQNQLAAEGIEHGHSCRAIRTRRTAVNLDGTMAPPLNSDGATPTRIVALLRGEKFANTVHRTSTEPVGGMGGRPAPADSFRYTFRESKTTDRNAKHQPTLDRN
jgi:hypothetical protein